jgi:hypothetical protein
MHVERKCSALPCTYRRALTIEERLIQQSEQNLLAHPLLLCSRPDSLWRQHKAVVTSIWQLDGHGEPGAANGVDVINRSASRWIQGRAARTEDVGGVILGAEAHFIAHQRSGFSPHAQFRRIESLFVSKGKEDELGVAVPVDVQLDALRITDLANQQVHTFVLRCISRLFSPVGLTASIRRRSTWVRVPVCLPVSVDLDVANKVSSLQINKGCAPLTSRPMQVWF